MIRGGEGDLPSGLEHVRTTRVFDHDSVPAGLLAAHRIAPGTWGRLVVRSGNLTFSWEDRTSEQLQVGAGEDVIIPPDKPHHLVIDAPVEFVVEFHRQPSDSPRSSPGA